MVDNRRQIKFNEALHSYTDNFGVQYTSVTTVIQEYHEKFNRDYWVAEKARETGLSAEAIKKNWDDIADFACRKGNRVHKELEDSINDSNGKSDFRFDGLPSTLDSLGYRVKINKTNLEILAKTPLATKYPQIYAFLRSKILEGWSMYAEKRIYWADFCIAGTIDCLLVRGQDFMIVDWKTNKDELKFESGYYQKDKLTGLRTGPWVKTNKKFFTPLSSLEDCKGNRYSMQLSLYAYLMEMWGYRCVGLVLYHIRDGNKEPKRYEITYLDWACKLLTMHFKTSRSQSNDSPSGESFVIT